MTEGPRTSPEGTPGASPFDDQGRLRHRAHANGSAGPGGPAAAGLGVATPPGAVPGTVPQGAYGSPAGGPFGAAPGQARPMNWPRTGAIPLGLTGPLALTGGIPLAGAARRRKRQTVSGFDPVVRGRGLARLSRRPQPTTASELQRAVVRWVVTLWAMLIVLQRFAVPNQPIALMLPLSVAWCVYGMFRGVLEVDRHRFGWWLAAAGASSLIVPFQYALSPDPRISMNSWGLLMVTWLVFVFRLRDRRRETYLKALAGMLKVSLAQASIVIFFLAIQLVVPYTDWIAQVVPSNLLQSGYTLAYPFSYEGRFYRSNGWIGLETSFTSMQLALGVIAALLLRKKLTVVLYLLAAIACTGAQSGIPMLGAAVAVILFSRMRWALARYLVMLPTLAAFLLSPLGGNTVTRLTEGTSQQTSTGQRSTVPYEVLWPLWSKNPLWVLFGRGPGSSQSLVEDSHILGVIVPTPIKLFFDYGVIAGLALGIFLLFMYLGGPSRAYAVAMITVYWLFQPGTGILLIITIPPFITWWTPRNYKMLESEFVPSPNAAIVPAQGRRPRSEIPS